MASPRLCLPLMSLWLPSQAVPAEHAPVAQKYLFIDFSKMKSLFINWLFRMFGIKRYT
jgi:hypothetical protein